MWIQYVDKIPLKLYRKTNQLSMENVKIFFGIMRIYVIDYEVVCNHFFL